MCDFEQNILKLLLEEKERLKPLIQKDVPLPYYKSLEHGIQTAKEKLEQCEEKLCRSEIYKQNKDIVPIYDLQRWSQMKFDMIQCSRKRDGV